MIVLKYLQSFTFYERFPFVLHTEEVKVGYQAPKAFIPHLWALRTGERHGHERPSLYHVPLLITM